MYKHLKYLFFFVSLFLVSACSDESASTFLDIDVGDQSYRGDREFVESVDFQTKSLEFQPNMTELPKESIETVLHNSVDSKEHCLQVVEVEESLMLEVFPFACPEQGFVKSQNHISFYLMIDAEKDDLLQSKDKVFNLVRKGYVLGEIERSAATGNLKLKDLFCYGFDGVARCDLLVKYKRLVDLRINRKFRLKPNKERFGYNDKGMRLSCPPIPGGIVSTEGSTFASLCNAKGFDELVCKGGPHPDKYLCEANLGKVFYGLGQKANEELKLKLQSVMPSQITLTKLTSSLYGFSIMDRNPNEEPQLTINFKSEPPLSHEEKKEMVARIKKIVQESPELSGFTVKGESGKLYSLNDFELLLFQDYSGEDPFGDDFGDEFPPIRGGSIP